MADLTPYSYRDLSDMHKRFQDNHPEVFGSMSLHDFSQKLNDITESSVGNAGLNDSWVKQASTAIDRGLDATGINDVFSSIGGAVGSAVGYEDAGKRAGHGFARGALNFLPMIAGEVLSGGAATPLIAGTALTAGLSGADAYTETGSAGAGLISGAAAALTPFAARAGGQLALKAAGAPIFGDAAAAVASKLPFAAESLPKIGERFATTTGQKIAQFVGSNLGAVADGEVAGELQSEVAGQGLYNPFTAEHLFETALSLGPYAALGIPGLRKSSAGEFVHNFMQTAEAARKADAQVAGQNLAAGVASNSDLTLSTASDSLSSQYSQSDLYDVESDFSLHRAHKNPYLEYVDQSRRELLSKFDSEKLFGLDVNDWNNRYQQLMQEWGTLDAQDRQRRYDDMMQRRGSIVNDINKERELARIDEYHRQWNELQQMEDVVRGRIVLPPDAPGIGESVDPTEPPKPGGAPSDPTPPPTSPEPTGVDAVEPTKVVDGVPVPTIVEPQRGAPDDSQRRDQGLGRKAYRGRSRYLDAATDIDEQLRDFYETNPSSSTIESVYNRPETELQRANNPLPLSKAVEESLARKDTSLPDKPTTGQVRQHIADTITIRDGLMKKYGFDLKQLTDTELVSRINQFAERNPTHPDPVSGFAESFRAETMRKANDDNNLRHAGQNIGTEEQAMHDGIKALADAPKATTDASGKTTPGDADTVARIIAEHEGGKTRGQRGLSNSVGIAEAVYRAYGTFAKDHKGLPYTQEQLAGYLSAAASKGRMKGEARLTKLGQTSFDYTSEHSPGNEEQVFANLDPGIKQEAQRRNEALDELHEDKTVAGHDVAAISDDLRLITTLGKLSWIVKERSDLWKTIWQKGSHDSGEARTRIYINLAFEKLQQRAGTITGSELNKAFAMFDAANGTSLAYMDKGKLASSVPVAMYEKLNKTFKYIDNLPDFGVEGVRGSRAFMSGMTLDSPEGTRNAGLISAGDFYSRMFRERMGYSKLQTAAMTEQMQRIVAAFGAPLDRLRVTALSGESSELGVYLKSLGNPLWRGVVGIAENNFGTARQNFVMHQLVLAHELTHGIENRYSLMQQHPESQLLPQDMYNAFQKMDELSAQLSPDQRSQFMGEIRDMILPRFKNADMDRILSQSANNPTEFRATIGALLAMNHVGEDVKSSKNLRQMYTEAPKQFGDMIRSTVRYMADMARTLWAALRGDELLGLRLGIARERVQPLSDAARQYVNLFNQVLASTNEIDTAVSKLQQFEELSPTAYTQMVAANRLDPIRPAAFEGAPDWAVEAMKGVKEDLATGPAEGAVRPSFLQRNLEQFTQLAERYPVLRAISNIAYVSEHRQTQNLAKLHSTLAMEVGADGKGKLDPKLTTAVSVAKNTAARDAFSEIARSQQDAKGLLARNDPKVTAALSKLPDALREQVWSMFERVNAQNVMVGNERVTAMHETNGLVVSKLIQELEPTRPAKATEQIGATLMAGLVSNDYNRISQAIGQLQPETAQKVSQLASTLADSWTTLKQRTESQPWYFTERRYGDYTVTYKTKEGKTGRASAPTQAQIDNIVSSEIKKGSTILTRLTPDDIRKPLSQFSESYRQAVSDAQDKSTAMLRTILHDQPELLRRIEPLLDIEADASAEMQANDITKLNPFRKHAAGREYVDYLDASMISNSATVRGLTRRWLRAKAALYTSDPTLAKEPALQRLAQQHVENVITPDGQLGQALTRANFYYYIVGNLANMIQEPFQQLGTILPALQREGGGFFDSQRKLLNANRSIANFWRSGKTGNAEHDAVLTRFANDRESPHGFLSEFDSDSLAAINAVRYANGQPILDRAKAVAKPLFSLVDLAKNAYLKVPEHNARVTILAAYDLGRSKGMSPTAAYEDAVRIYRYSNFAGGKANRPVGVYSGKDPFTRSAAQTVLSLQTYQIGYLGMMSRLIHEGFGKGKLAGPEGVAAKKAAITMLGIQFALAGGLGMPFAGQSVALLQQLFPGLQLQKNLREGIAGLIGDDSDAAGFITNSITHGVLGELGGVDLSSRFGLGNMFGISSYGYDPTNMLGPTGGLVSKMVLGIQDASTGDFGKMTQDIVPPGLRGVVKAYQQDGQFRDNKGNLMFEGTGTEKAFRVLGYTPSRERDIREQQTIMRRSEQVSSQELSRFYNDLAERVGGGDYNGVREALMQRQRDDYSFDARAGLRKVAQMSEERLNPMDMRDQGSSRNADDRQRLLQTYNSQGGPSEVQRLQQRANIERMVGINGAGRISPTEIKVAQMADHLRQIYPTMTIAQVRALASHTIANRMSEEQRQELLPQGYGN